jgi:hypothetical protein
MFSQRGSSFPWAGGPQSGGFDQGTGEFEAHQVVAIRVRHPQRSRPQIASCLGQRVRDGEGSAGDFQQNLRGERQRAAHGDEGATRRDVKRGGEFEDLLAFFVAAAHEDRYRDRETRPLTALCCDIQTLQTDLSKPEINLPSAPWGPNQAVAGCHCP